MRSKAWIISAPETHPFLTFFTRTLRWFSLSSRTFLKVQTSLHFSESSLWSRWLVLSRVRQRACVQKQQPITFLTTPIFINGFVEALLCFPPDSQMDLVAQPNTESLWRFHWGENRFKTTTQNSPSVTSGSDKWQNHNTHLLLTSSCNNRLCRKACSLTCLCFKNSPSKLSFNQRLGGRARPMPGNNSLSWSGVMERWDNRRVARQPYQGVKNVVVSGDENTWTFTAKAESVFHCHTGSGCSS